MKYFIKLNFFSLIVAILCACSPSDNLDSTETQSINETHEIDNTPVMESIKEESIRNILNQFKIMDIVEHDKNINPTLNYSSQLVTNKVFKEIIDATVSDKNINPTLNYSSRLSENKVSRNESCNHEIKNEIDNKVNNFDLNRDYISDPLTEEEIQQNINAPIVSTTLSSIKYFLSDKTPSTDCETEELDAPVPNHDDKDKLLRPTFYSYDDVFDYKGEHHYSNKFYIERSEITTPKDWDHASSKFITKGVLEKRIDREHQVHVYTKAIHSHVEDLELSGFMRSQEDYRFHFMNGSSKYFKYSFVIEEELSSNPTYGRSEIDMVNRYIIQFYINYEDSRVDGVYRLPFLFDITIDYKEIIEVLKENRNTTPYTKTVPLYVKTGNINRNIGNVKFTLNEEETWDVNVFENPIIISDSELEYIIDNFK